MKRSITTVLITVLYGIAAYAADPGSGKLPVAVFDFEASDSGKPALGASFSGIVAADLSTLPPFVSLLGNKLAGLPERPQFGTVESTGPETAARIGRLTGAIALVNGRVIISGQDATVVAKIIDTATGRVYGEMVQGDITVPLADLAAQISLKIAALVMQVRGLPAGTWPSATIFGVAGGDAPPTRDTAVSVTDIDGLKQQPSPKFSILPGVHNITISGRRNGAIARASFTFTARPGGEYRAVLKDEPNQKIRLWLSEAVSGAAVTNTIDRSWIAGPDNPLVSVATYHLPGPRFGTAVVADSNAIYVVGGQEGGGRRHFLDEIVRFDLHTHELTVLTRSVFPRGYFGAGLVGGKIYIMGGDAWNATLHTMQIFDIATKQMSDGPRMPRSRRNFSAVVVGNRIYLVGGSVFGRNTTQEVDIFDVGANTWTKGPPMPYGVEGQAALVGDRLIFPGGYAADSRVHGFRANTENVLALDLRDGRWGLLPPLSMAMGASGVAALDRHMYLFGDYVEIGRAIAYDTNTGRSLVFDLGEKGYRYSAAIAAGKMIYVIGGSLPSTNLASDEINVFFENPNWNNDAD